LEIHFQKQGTLQFALLNVAKWADIRERLYINLHCVRSNII